MPYAVLENVYSTLTEEEQKEVVDFVLYLASRKEKQKNMNYSFVDNLFGKLSKEEAADLSEHSHLHFKEN